MDWKTDVLPTQGWGKTIVLGVDKPGSKLSLSCSEVLVQGKNLMGCLFGGLKPKSDVPILLKRYMDKVLTTQCNFFLFLIFSKSMLSFPSFHKRCWTLFFVKFFLQLLLTGTEVG